MLAEFVDTLSNWYVRRSRRRFWAGEPGALWTLHQTLEVLTRLMAPIAPFITERVWSDLYVASGTADVDSVHIGELAGGRRQPGRHRSGRAVAVTQADGD